MEPYTYTGSPFGVRATRVDDKVTICIDRNGTTLVEIVTTRKGAKAIAEQIERVLW
jgi:hypothetical protein